MILLDYGLTDEVKPSSRRAMIMLSLALDAKDLNTITQLTTEIANSRIEASSLALQAMREGKSDVASYLEFLVQNGVSLSSDIISLKRGLLLVEQLLRNAGSGQKSVTLLKTLGNDVVRRDLKTRLFSFGRKTLTPLTYRDIYQLRGNENGAPQNSKRTCEDLFL